METVALAYDVYETPETQKDKCPIIFLHGLFWNKYMLRDLAESMCYLTERKVFCLDLRCHDKSPFRKDWGVEIMAEDVKRFIEDRKLERISFVCHSFSSTIAYLVLIDKPEVVEKVVMIDHPPYLTVTENVFKREVYPQFAVQNRYLKTLDQSLSLSAAKRKIMNLSEEVSTEGQRIFLEKIAYELIKVNDQFKWKTDHKFLIDGYRDNYRLPCKGRSDHEILIIRNKGSTLVTYSAMESVGDFQRKAQGSLCEFYNVILNIKLDEKFEAVLKYNPNATLKTIDDTSHLLMFEKPDEFLEAVKDFLS